MSATNLQSMLDSLAASGAGIRCKDMIRWLEGLGFVVRKGKKQGHRVITHPGLAAFTAASFSCGHGRNPQVKPVYVARIRKLLEAYSEDLRRLEGG